jgi:DNA invertase Pin-like site-specific DNA recombinase
MLDACKRGLAEVILVSSFDRFSRSTIDLLTITDELKSSGVALVSEKEQVDTTSPMGKFFFTILSGIAELERGIIVDRVTRGMARAKKEGRHCGRPPRGYKVDPSTKKLIKINEEVK